MANDISKFPVPLIFKKLLKDKISGTLVVSHPTENWEKKIYFINGRLAFAQSTIDKEKLGEILLAAGKIERSQLEMAIEVRNNVPTKIGEILAKLCDLSMRDIFMGLNDQTKQIAVSTFALNEGEWRFIVGKAELPNPNTMSIKLTDIVREGTQKLTHISYFKKRFYYRSPVTLELPEDIGDSLTHRENEFYLELSRLSNTSVKTIFDNLQIPEITFWRNLIQLYLLNVIDFVEFTVDNEEKNKKIEEINEVYRKISVEKINHFQLLGIPKNASRDEIKERFSALATKLDPEKLDIPPDSTSRFRADHVQAQIRKAYEAACRDAENRTYQKAPPPSLPPLTQFNQSEPKQVFAGASPAIPMAVPGPPPVSLSKDDTATLPPPQPDIKKETQPAGAPTLPKNYAGPELPGEGEENKIQKARDLFVKGNHLYNQKRYFEAVSILEEAVTKDTSKADYFLLLGLCQSKMAATKKNAERNLKKAAAMEPWNADPLFALGQLYKSENLMNKAKACYEKALEINMEHTLAGKAMNEMNDIFGKGNKKSLFSMFGKKK